MKRGQLVPDNATFTCASGGEWYACTTGTKFVGCCSVNPCTEMCPTHALHPIAFDPSMFGKFADLSCGSGGGIFTCSKNQTFYGCCKSNPCLDGGCPIGDLLPTFAGRDDLISSYSNPDLNFVGAAPLTTASPKQASGPLSPSPHLLESTSIGRTGALTLMGTSIAVMVSVIAGIGLWLCYRRLAARSNGKAKSAEPQYLPAMSEEPTKNDTQASCQELGNYSAVHDTRRLGTKTIYMLLASTLFIAGICSLVTFLWFADSRNTVWHAIMVKGWATRAVALSALILRTAIDVQAAIACAILASLLIESENGMHLFQLASISPMRAGTTSPWTLASSLIAHFRLRSLRYRWNYHICVMAVCLLVTTSILQFSSTLLLSDLQIGPLIGRRAVSEVRTSISYSGDVEKIPRDSSWTAPPMFPAFAEYSEAPVGVGSGIADTGVLLRGFLPFETAEARQRLAYYEGNALVLDARVSCQAPTLTQFQANAATALNRQLIGVVAPSQKSDMFEHIKATPFRCSVAWEGQVSICQVGHRSGSFTGSLTSHFTNSTTYGTAFLVIHAASRKESEWLEVTTKRLDKTGNSLTAQVSMSLCFAPWDAAILKVSLSSEANRTEPALRYWKGYQSSEVLEYLIPGTNTSMRPIMKMDKPQSLLGDRPPPQRRPIVQSDMGSSSAAVRGTVAPLPGNWTAFVGGIPLVTVLDGFSYVPPDVISADPALAAIFTDALKGGHSVSWALSSLLTALSATNYYNQQAAFDRLDDVLVSFFDDVLYPRDNRGFTAFMWVIVAHFIIVGILVVLFITSTRHTLLGNVWSAFAQLAESQDVRKHLVDTSTMADNEVWKRLDETQASRLRVKVAKQGLDSKVVVAE